MTGASKRRSKLAALLKSDKKNYGNSIAEYALPLALVVVSAGVIAAAVNMKDILPNYFAQASGSSVSGTTLQTRKLGDIAEGGANGTGAAAIGFSDTNGMTSTMGLAGQKAPGVETVGGNGTDGIIQAMQHMIMKVPQMETSESDGGLYVPLTVDMALTTKTGQFENAPILAAKGNAIASYAQGHSIEIMMVGGFSENQDINGKEVDNLGKKDNTQSDTHGDKELNNVGKGTGITEEQAALATHLAGMFGGGGGTYHSSSNYQALDEEMFWGYIDDFRKAKLNCASVHIEQFEGKKQVNYDTLVAGGINNGCK